MIKQLQQNHFTQKNINIRNSYSSINKRIYQAKFQQCKAMRREDVPPIMVNSCTGKMGNAVAEAVVRAGLKLIPYTITGDSQSVQIEDINITGIPVQVVGMEVREQKVAEIKNQHPGLIIVDFTLPQVVNDNASFYVKNQLPFVMGTTGGDRQKLMQEVEQSGLYTVIAPQMGKQVVAFQAMMKQIADQFPGSFSGYTLEVVESHQSTKVDTSGTAKAVVESLQQLGVKPFNIKDIKQIRDVNLSLKMGVPEASLNGHAFHTYTLTSADGQVQFQFKHNVQGRSIYAEGTVDACIFLAQKIQQKASKKIYNMIDVLQEGALR